eukprot:Nitzschia sp. Nitz4//scaffold203_size38902//30440//33526//NITZ4_007666-RA/size38902-processed-gene-0.73-mRNA-1//-1//CDS//3329541442//8107//frame0
MEAEKQSNVVEVDLTQGNDEEDVEMKDANNDDDASVVVVSPSKADRDLHRRRRRRLRRMLEQSNQLPSFMAVLHLPPETEESLEPLPPPVVVIDVDEYLGLNQSAQQAIMPPPGPVSSDSNIPAHVSSADTPISTPSSSAVVPVASSANPADDGWYEGARLMAMPEDTTFLSDAQIGIRQHLEYFSATTLDVERSVMGRRTRIVRGMIGLRCIHCARNVLPKLERGEYAPWPSGAVTFPHDFSSLYSSCSQKPQLHFENCPNLPPDSELSRLLKESRAKQGGTAPLVGIGKRKRMVQGLSGLMYYIISCERIGIQELPNQGLRFARDLALEPLDFEATRMHVEQSRPDLIPRQYQNRLSMSPPPSVVSQNTATQRSGEAAPVLADAECQAVVQKCWDELTDELPYIIRRSDKAFLSDFMFVTICQVALCHATPMDVGSRGKKTKSMRTGLAGFCCRHCLAVNAPSGCRSFSSAPDHLASAVSNSFVIHLQKCRFAPDDVKASLAPLKRIHSRQMSTLPYGSQRKLFFEVWTRLREADRFGPDGGDEDNTGNDGMSVGTGDGAPSDVSMSVTGQEDSVTGDSHSKSTPVTLFDQTRPNSRIPEFPISGDPVTQQCLQDAEDNWDPTVNDHLIESDDRYLVSDYVFLTMRQLKIAMPTAGDFRGNRRNTSASNRVAGMCCIHCAADSSIPTPSGRTFPSAPDNLASALNNSLYNHMQVCPHISRDVKLAFQQLRKIHSQQCASLTFGSQRRFFNKVFDKLRQVQLSQEQLAAFDVVEPSRAFEPAITPPLSRRTASVKQVTDAKIFDKHSFVEAGSLGAPYWQCLKCRMVPFEFRATGAVHYVRPSVLHLQNHITICQKNNMFLGWLRVAMAEAKAAYPACDETTLKQILEPLVTLVVGDDAALAKKLVDGGSERLGTPQETIPLPSNGWWCRESVAYSQLQEMFEAQSSKLGGNNPSSKLIDHPKLRRVLEIVAPTLQFPVPGSEDENSDNKAAETEDSASGAPESEVSKPKEEIVIDDDDDEAPTKSS